MLPLLLKWHPPHLQNARLLLHLLAGHQHLLAQQGQFPPRLPLRLPQMLLSLQNPKLIQRKRPFVQERKLSKKGTQNALLAFGN